jgi:hypothetical protein
MALRLNGEVFNLPKEAKKNGAKGCDGQQGADDKNGQHWSSQTRTSGLNSIFNPGHGHLHRSPISINGSASGKVPFFVQGVCRNPEFSHRVLQGEV